jgi:putative Holliday junction resolvase
MPLRNPTDLPDLLRPGERLAGLDLGTKTIGIALSDAFRSIASPLTTLTRKRFQDDAAALKALCDQHRIAALILGLPLNMDGSEGPRVQATRAFARNLLALHDPVIVFWDERMSTQAVTRGMIEGDLSRKRRSEIVDQVAASWILQGVLDRLSYLKTAAERAAL